VSHAGCCYDNAVMERFFWPLKHQWTNHREYADLAEARLIEQERVADKIDDPLFCFT